MNRKSLRIAIIVLALTGVSGCAALEDGVFFDTDFWTIKEAPQNNQAEIGLAELAKGNNVEALSRFERALRANPSDIHALYGSAVLYQNTGQPARARELYQHILSMNPRPSEELLVWAGKETQPIVDLANVNMHLLQSGMPAGLDPAQSAGGMASSSSGVRPSLTDMASAPTNMSQMELMTQPQSPGYAPQSSGRTTTGVPLNMFKEGDVNIVARFKALRTLLDQGLLTQDEFVVRRKVNIGALLPLTSPPPAAGLDRPVPGVNQISSRLRAIGRALEMRALSPAQHMAERSMILDALMPMSPSNLAGPALPPKGLMEAADAVRRLELLKAEDLITSDEYTRERAAIEGSMQPAPPRVGNVSVNPLTAQAPMDMRSQSSTSSSLSGFQPALHLASYRQRNAAERGWAALRKRFSTVLGDLEHTIERVDLGGGKGVFYRLKAGPMPSNGAAKDACRTLKSSRQYCEPTTINFG